MTSTMTGAPDARVRLEAALIGLRRALAATAQASESLYAGLDVAIRFWLAQVFLAQAAVSVVMHHPMAMAGQARAIAAFNHLVQSPLGAAVEWACPVLVLLGLSTRLAAVPLLVQVLVLSDPGLPAAARLAWAVLLGALLICGPGPVSLDGVLGQGLDSTAIPGAAPFAALCRRTRVLIGPWYRLGIRLFLATALAAAAPATLAAAMPEWPGPAGALAPWLAGLPAMPLPPAAVLSLAGLLVLGLATRAAAIVPLLALSTGMTGMVGGDRFAWILLLATLALRGAGPLSLDRLLNSRLARVMRQGAGPAAALPHVVIVGGGFAGLAAARGLRRAPCRVTLLDRRNYHLFQPLLYQVATAGLSPADIAAPIRGMFRNQANVRVLFGEVVGVAAAARQVLLADAAPLAYDHLVLATGAQHSYFGHEAWAAAAPGLKSIEDATDIRRRLLLGFERAESCGDAQEAAASTTFVIVGGGPTGVELAGAIAELARHGLADEFRAVDPTAAKVILVQAAPRLLPAFPASLSADAAEVLRGLGVDVRLGAKVEAVDRAGVMVSGQRIEARTVLWAAGVEASPAGRWLGAATDRAGRILVGPDLSVPGHGDVYAIGDTAASTGWNGNPVPGLAPAAKQAGAYVAKVIRARLTRQAAPRPFAYRHRGSLATIGRQAAVAEFGPLRVRRALAWWLWGLVHVLFLVGFRNRLTVMLEWAWAYFTYRRGTRLITRAAMAEPSGAAPKALT